VSRLAVVIVAIAIVALFAVGIGQLTRGPGTSSTTTTTTTTTLPYIPPTTTLPPQTTQPPPPCAFEGGC
jgi:hypothetical protein